MRRKLNFTNSSLHYHNVRIEIKGTQLVFVCSKPTKQSVNHQPLYSWQWHWISPTCIYSFKSVYNGNARKLYEICSTKKTPETLTRISLTTFWCLHCKLWTNFILFWRFHCWLWTSKCRLGKFLTLENCLNMTHTIGSLCLNAYGVCDHTHVNFKSFFNLVHMAKVA